MFTFVLASVSDVIFLVLKRHSRMRRVIVLLAFVLCAHPNVSAMAQEGVVGGGTLDGTVIDRQTRRPIAAAAVLIEGTSLTAVSDADGRFQIRAPLGTLTLRIEAPGYVGLSQGDILISRGRVTTVTFELSAAQTGFADQLTVRGSAFEKPPGVTTTSYGVAYEEVRRTAGAIGDISRHLQSLPGLAHSTDERNDLIARGGSPSENLTLVDGFEVPNLNHFGSQGTTGGAISMLNNEVLGDATFLAGGFPARFGNRLSSVLDVRLRDGNRDRFEAESDVSFAGASVVLEGPLGSKGSWIGSVRRSYLELLKSSLDLPTVPEYGSYQGKFVYDLNASNRIWAMGLGGYDNFRFKVDESDLDEPSLEAVDDKGRRFVTGIGWQQLFGDRGYGRLTVSNAMTRYGVEVHDRQLADQLTFRDQSREQNTNVNYDVAWRFGREMELQAGGGFKRMQGDVKISQPLGVQNPRSTDPTRVDVVDVNTSIVANIAHAYAQMTTRIAPRTHLTFGLRGDRYAYLDETRVSPRVGLTVDLTSKITASASAGRYYQQPELVYLAATPANRALDPIRADHVVAGLAYVPSPDLKLSLEVYQKKYADYPVSLEYPTMSLANIGEQNGIDSFLMPMASLGTGRARGVEFFLQKKLTGSLYGQVSYTFARTRHAALDGVLRPGAYDSPHTFATILGYKMGPRWEFSTRFTYASGRPYTPPLLAESYAQNRWIEDLAQVNASRMPDYHRLDLRADRTFLLGRINLALYMEVQNVYNRENVGSFSWNPKTRQPITDKQLGLLPVFGINVQF
jgi:hypothetical protein